SKLDADDLLIGGPALSIEGDVTGGIILAVPPKDGSGTGTDKDNDGIEDAKEGSAAVRSYGSAPAMRIGATGRDIAIGAVAGTGTGFGLIIDGTVTGNGLYAGIDGLGVQIGGMGGAVDIAGGMGVAGTVSALSKDSSATAILIGAGATVPEVRIAGKVEAAGGGTATAISTALRIDSGADVALVRNSGTISAKASGED